MTSRKLLHSFYFTVLLSSFHFDSCAQAATNFKTAYHYQAQPYTLQAPRGLTLDESGDVLAVSRGSSHITAVYENGKSVKTAVIVEATDLKLNHGVAYYNGYLYASSDSTVYRWRYISGRRTKITGAAEVIVNGIPAGGNHTTRTLAIDEAGFLYLSVGSATNVNVDPKRSQIRRFNLFNQIPQGGIGYDAGEIFATGLRNAVGLTFDHNGILWGVDCGADELERKDLGEDIHNTNPADELIKFGLWRQEYGYPYCWTVDQLDGHHKGEQFAWPDFMDDGTHDDAWCRQTLNNKPPTLPLPAHNAPLGITFYDGKGCDSGSGAFPCSMKGDAFVAFHGSWNKEPPSGYKVSRIPINSQTGQPSGVMEDILYDPSPASCVTSPATCLRPVDLVFNHNGHLIVTSDSSNEIFKITYKESVGEKIKKGVHIPGVLGIVLIAFATVGLLGMVIFKFCCCRKNSNVPYVREQI